LLEEYVLQTYVKYKTLAKHFTLNVCYVLFDVCLVWCVSICNGHSIMVRLSLTQSAMSATFFRQYLLILNDVVMENNGRRNKSIVTLFAFKQAIILVFKPSHIFLRGSFSNVKSNKFTGVSWKHKRLCCLLNHVYQKLSTTNWLLFHIINMFRYGYMMYEVIIAIFSRIQFTTKTYEIQRWFILHGIKEHMKTFWF